MRFVANCALVLVLAGVAAVPAQACNGRRTPAPAPVRQYHCPVRPAPGPAATPVVERTFCICTPDENGVMHVRKKTSDKLAAQLAAEILENNGVKAWAMEMKPVPRGSGLVMSNGKAAVAIAVNIGPGKTRTVAIGEDGRAEAQAEVAEE